MSLMMFFLLTIRPEHYRELLEIKIIVRSHKETLTEHVKKAIHLH